MMDLYASAAGLVSVEIVSADLPRTLKLLSEAGVVLHHISRNGGLVTLATLSRSDYQRAKYICEKQGAQLKLKHRQGIYWLGKALLGRPVLLAALAAFLLGALYLPSRIFFVRVEGNSRIPELQILEAASECGIGFGAERRDVRSERMKNALLEAMPQLQWAGVNTYGCVAVITVRERPVEETGEQAARFGHIVAIQDGIITHCTATRGNLLCAPGQAVSRGEILISGYTDCTQHIRAELAQGEVYGQTRRRVSAVLPTACRSIRSVGAEKKKISLLIGKKRINLWKDSGIWDTTCDRMYEEYYITLPGGFQLPVALTVERYALRELAEAELDAMTAREILTRFAQTSIVQRMIAGTILHSELSFWTDPGIAQLAGEYDCTELIGVLQQIGEYNGKTD